MLQSSKSCTVNIWTCLTLGCLLSANSEAAEAPIHSGLTGFEKYTIQINEFTDRRRTNTLFKNAQAPDRGVQLGYVNVGVGNLTFARRDLVVADQIPIVVTRVYDSSLASGDFGKGWKISFAEEIYVSRPERLDYIDESLSTIVIRKTATGYIAPPNAGIRTVTKTDSSTFEIAFSNGFLKRFSGGPTRFALTSVKDLSGNWLSLTYSNGFPSSVRSSSGKSVRISRDASNRISAITDSLGRGVFYSYSNGLLTNVTDINGNDWRYHYGVDGQLTKLENPDGSVIGEVSYYKDGRVRESEFNGISNRYRYDHGITVVKDRLGHPAVFKQDSRGFTVSVRNRHNVLTSLGFDSIQRVINVGRDGGSIATLNYSDDNRVVEIEEFQDGSELIKRTEITKEDSGRVKNIVQRDVASKELLFSATYQGGFLRFSTREDHEQVNYDYNERGQVSRIVGSNRGTLDFQFDELGQVSSIYSEDKEATLNLSYSELGNLRTVTFPDGSGTLYGYDGLGMRSRATPSYSYGGTAAYTYTPRGSLESIVVTDFQGYQYGQDISLDQSGRVNVVTFNPAGSTTEVSYDENSNPTKIVMKDIDGDEKTTLFSYDDRQRLVSVKTPEGEEMIYHYRGLEEDIRLQYDKQMTEVVSTWYSGNLTFGGIDEVVNNRLQFRSYEYVVFDEIAQEFKIIATGQDATRLFENALVRHRIDDLGALSTEQGKLKFEMPSNGIYLPAEYSNTNCCYPCTDPSFCQGYPYVIITCDEFIGCSYQLVYSCSPPPSCNSEVLQMIGEYSTFGVALSPVCGDFEAHPSSYQYSPHFTWSEYNGGWSSGNPHPNWGMVKTALKNGLEATRNAYGRPIIVSSGYRCPHGNHNVNGAAQSYHMHGRAADLYSLVSVYPWTEAEFLLVKSAAESASNPIESLDWNTYTDHHYHAAW